MTTNTWLVFAFDNNSIQQHNFDKLLINASLLHDRLFMSSQSEFEQMTSVDELEEGALFLLAQAVTKHQ